MDSEVEYNQQQKDAARSIQSWWRSSLALKRKSRCASKIQSWWREIALSKKTVGELKTDFDELCAKTAAAFEKQEHLERPRRCLLTHDWGNSVSSKISSVTIVPEIFDILREFSDFLHPNLLVPLVKNFEEKQLQRQMLQYMSDINRFRRGENVKDFINKWSGILPEKYKEVTVILGNEWESKTLADLEDFRMELAKQMSLSQHVVKIRGVLKGSTSVVFVLPVFPKVNESLGTFLLENNIEKLFVRGHQIDLDQKWIRKYERKATVAHFCNATKKISTEWYSIGQQAGLPIDELDKIMRCVGNTKYKQSRMFHLWKKYDKNCSWQKLIQIIDEMGLTVIANEVWDYSCTCKQEDLDLNESLQTMYSRHMQESEEWRQEEAKLEDQPPPPPLESSPDNLSELDDTAREKVIASQEEYLQAYTKRADDFIKQRERTIKREESIRQHQTDIESSIGDIEQWIEELQDDQQSLEREMGQAVNWGEAETDLRNNLASCQNKLTQAKKLLAQSQEELRRTDRDLESCKTSIRRTESELQRCIKELERCEEAAIQCEIRLQIELSSIKIGFRAIGGAATGAAIGGTTLGVISGGVFAPAGALLGSVLGAWLGSQPADRREEELRKQRKLQNEVIRCAETATKCLRQASELKTMLENFRKDIT